MRGKLQTYPIVLKKSNRILYIIFIFLKTNAKKRICYISYIYVNIILYYIVTIHLITINIIIYKLKKSK